MNSETRERLEKLFKEPTQTAGLDWVGMTAIPQNSDRMATLRSLEDALEEFDGKVDSGDAYLVLVRERKRPTATTPNLTPELAPNQKPTLDGIYFPNGKLNAQFLIKNAELLFQSGDYPLSRNIFRTLLNAGEKVAIAHFGIGRCHQAEGKVEAAIAHYEESITYHPTQVVYRRLISALVSLGKFREAAESTQKALVMKDLSPAVRSELNLTAGNCFTRLNQINDAETHYLAALDADPMADAVRANLGALYLQNGRVSDAKRQFQDAAASNPRNAKAHEGLGACAYAEGDRREAHDAFAKSLEIEIQNANAIFYLIKCAYELKSYATAARLAEAYVQVSPVNANMLYSLAGLQFHLGKFSEAEATARRALSIQADHQGALDLVNRVKGMTPTSNPIESEEDAWLRI